MQKFNIDRKARPQVCSPRQPTFKAETGSSQRQPPVRQGRDFCATRKTPVWPISPHLNSVTIGSSDNWGWRTWSRFRSSDSPPLPASASFQPAGHFCLMALSQGKSLACLTYSVMYSKRMWCGIWSRGRWSWWTPSPPWSRCWPSSPAASPASTWWRWQASASSIAWRTGWCFLTSSPAASPPSLYFSFHGFSSPSSHWVWTSPLWWPSPPSSSACSGSCFRSSTPSPTSVKSWRTKRSLAYKCGGTLCQTSRQTGFSWLAGQWINSTL